MNLIEREDLLKLLFDTGNKNVTILGGEPLDRFDVCRSRSLWLEQTLTESMGSEVLATEGKLFLNVLSVINSSAWRSYLNKPIQGIGTHQR